MSLIDSNKCVICLESQACGISCQSNHFICSSDVNNYLSENIFPQLFKLRESMGVVTCPAIGCLQSYDPMLLFAVMTIREKSRFLSILENITTEVTGIRLLIQTFNDLMILKCPTCKTSVDPLPDACSAVLCLNCGHHYCNFCFAKFSSENFEADRAECHTHAASHKSNSTVGGSDAFLSAEVVAAGQLEHRQSLLVHCIKDSLAPQESGSGHTSTEVAMALIRCSRDLNDLNLDIVDAWRRATCCSESSSACDCASESAGAGASGGSEFDEDDRVTHTATATNRTSGLALANAIITNNRVAVEQLLSAFATDLNLNYVDVRHGQPLCSLAILTGQHWLACELLLRGCDPMQVNTAGRTVLYIAVEAGASDVVATIISKHPALISSNSPTTTEKQKYTTLHVAARYNHGNLVEMLVKNGGDLHLTESEHGYSPLCLALVLGCEWVARELILAGAPVDVPGVHSRTAMFLAAEKGLVNIIDLMIRQRPEILNQAVVAPGGMTLLHVAAFHNMPAVVSQLIAHKAELNAPEEDNQYTPLVMAILSENIVSALELVQVGASLTCLSSSGRAPLYVAIERGLLEVVRAIIQHNPSSINKPAQLQPPLTPLQTAIMHKRAHMLPFLISSGADVNLNESADLAHSPLMLATLLGDSASVNLLLQAGANTTTHGPNGRTPLYCAIEKGHSAIIRLLIADSSMTSIDINASVTLEYHQSSALHVAAVHDNAFIVQLLLEHGADASKVNKLGRTALEAAMDSGSRNAAHVIRTHLANQK